MRGLLQRKAWLTLAPAVLALSWVCRGLLRGEVFYERDQLLVFLPLKKYLAERLRAGDLPAWWPWDGLGQPLAAIPIASVFHPTTLAYLALPFEWAYSLQTLVAFPVALLGAWLLGRTLGLGRWGAALAATTFTCGFYFVALAEQTQMHLAAMSVPWVWRFAVQVSRSRAGSRVGLALAVANLMLGGDPMLLELTALTTAALVLGGGRRRPAGVGRVALASVAGLVLSAVQWVPMAFVLSESPRAAGLGIDVSDFWAVRGSHLAGMVWPGSFAPETFLFETTYVGLPTLALAVLGASRRWRWRGPLLGVLVFSLVLSVGRAAGLWSVLSAVLPGWQGFQFPAKALSGFALALSLLAGRGVSVLVRVPRWGVRLGPVALVLVTLELVTLGPDIVTRSWDSLAPSPAVAALRSVGVGLGGQSYLAAYRVKSYEHRVDADRWNWESVKPSSGAWHGVPSSIPYLQGFTRRYYDVAIADQVAWLSKRASLFGNAAFVLRSFDVSEAQRPRVLAVLPDSDATVVRASQTMPFAYLSWNVHRVPEADAVAALSGRHTVVPADGEWAVPENFEQRTERPMEPVRVRHQGDVIELTVEAPAPAVLVINEAFTRATRAYEGEVELPVFPANHAVVGLALPAGTHSVRLIREVEGLSLGIGLSLLGLLVLLIDGRRQRE